MWKYLAVGALCLALGIAGTAGAARLITGRDIKDGSIGLRDLSRRARAALSGAAGPAGATGAQGPQGPQGPAGANGAAGAPGTSGSTAPALMVGVMGVVDGDVRYAPPAGGGGTSLSEPEVPVPPGTGLVARDFTAAVPAAPAAGRSITVTFRLDRADTALTCTIPSGATTCAAPDTTVALAAGAKMSIRATATAGAGASVASWGFRVVF